MDKVLRMLCVDDEPHILHSLQRFCRNQGFAMLSATSVSEALGVLRREKVSIILSDFRMREMTGLEFLRQAHTLRPGIVGIILSGYADIPVVSQALRDGEIFGFVPKPWRRDELAALLMAAADRCPPSDDDA
jgi:DNA-binding NtrC family response regulator